MIIPSHMSPRTRVALIMAILAITFLALRLPGLDMPYHQDEAKNVVWSMNAKDAGIFFAHPPLMQMIFAASYKIVGPEGFRLPPLLFSVIATSLLYVVVKRKAGESAALWSVGLAVACFYNIFGSLQPDVDGAILPAVFLLSVYLYDKFTEARPPDQKIWFILLVLGCLVGFLIKLNFVLVIGVLALDYLWIHRKSLSIKRCSCFVLSLLGFGAVYVGSLYLIQAIYPYFSIATMLGHAHQFTGDEGRNWIQIIVQGTKAIYFLSPLLILPLAFISKDILKRTRVFWLYLVVGFIFYFVLFDFSRGALDKYQMFAIVPLAAVCGVIFSGLFRGKSLSSLRVPVIIGTIASVALVALNFLPQTVAGLYPKTEYFSRVLHGEWNVLTPFTGGSGPLGFYVSFLFIAASFIVSAFIVSTGLCKQAWRSGALVAVLVIGLAYNLTFAEELMMGRINGNAGEVLRPAVTYIKDNPAIKSVMTYNDIGNHELTWIGKYARRIYAIPDAEEGYRALFSKFDGQYLVVDVPHLYTTGFYGRFFARCDPMFEATSKRITARVYDCAKAKAVIDTI